MSSFAKDLSFEVQRDREDQDEEYLQELIETAISVAIRLGYSDTAATLFSVCENVSEHGSGDLPHHTPLTASPVDCHR